MDFFDERKNTVFVNTSIHQRVKLSKEEFLERVKKVEALRTRQSEVSLFIRDEDDHYSINDLWSFVNEGDFRLRTFPDYVLFVVAIENGIFHWFKNSELELIKKQICNWIAALCLANPESKEDILGSIYEPYKNEIQYIIENYYSYDFKEEYSHERFDLNDIQQQRQLILDRNAEYAKASLKYLNCPPPKELPNPFEDRISISSYRDFETAFPKIYIQAAYFRNDDWIQIVERDFEKFSKLYAYMYSEKELKRMFDEGSDDSLQRAESQKEPWEIWRGEFEKPRFSKLFKPIGDNLSGGFVYLLKEEFTNYYKVGYTGSENGVPSRRSGSQTGNPRKLLLLGYFPVSSKRTEDSLQEHFKEFRKEGEWFGLTSSQAENILSEEWRTENHFF